MAEACLSLWRRWRRLASYTMRRWRKEACLLRVSLPPLCLRRLWLPFMSGVCSCSATIYLLASGCRRRVTKSSPNPNPHTNPHTNPYRLQVPSAGDEEQREAPSSALTLTLTLTLTQTLTLTLTLTLALARTRTQARTLTLTLEPQP